MAKPLTASSVFFSVDPKRLQTRLLPERETATRAVVSIQRLCALAAAVGAWRTYRRGDRNRPTWPIGATVLLAVDLATGIREQVMDLDEVLCTVRQRSVDEEWPLSEQELRRIALQLYAHPERAPDPMMEPAAASIGVRFVVRSLVGSSSQPNEALAAANALEIGGQR